MILCYPGSGLAWDSPITELLGSEELGRVCQATVDCPCRPPSPARSLTDILKPLQKRNPGPTESACLSGMSCCHICEPHAPSAVAVTAAQTFVLEEDEQGHFYLLHCRT